MAEERIWVRKKWNAVVPRGSGKCFDCKGTGQIHYRDYRCRDCKGTGRCSWCGGTGIRQAWHCQCCSGNNDRVAERVYYEKVGRHTPLDEVLAAISEEEQARIAGKRCDAARESFPLTQVTVSGFPEFESTISRFMARYCPRAGCHEHFCPDDPSGGADHLLLKIFGGPDIPLRMAMTGEAGGTRAVCNALHEHMKGLAMKKHVKHIIDYFEAPERERLMEQYSRRFAVHLPVHLRGRRAFLLAETSFEEVMFRHASVVEPALRAEAERA